MGASEGLRIRAHGLSKTYPSTTRVCALDGVNLDVPAGEFLAVTGPSGSGKSTLLNLVGTLDRPTAGTVYLDGTDISRLKGDQLADFRREQIGFIFQLFHLVPVLTAQQNVMLPLLPYRRIKFDLKGRAKALLAAVGLAHRAGHLPAQLSGGEQQRVAIARALINKPRLLLADEPTGNMDSQAGAEIVALLRSIKRKHDLTVVLVTHDPAVAAQADRVIRLKDGQIVSGAGEEAIHGKG